MREKISPDVSMDILKGERTLSLPTDEIGFGFGIITEKGIIITDFDNFIAYEDKPGQSRFTPYPATDPGLVTISADVEDEDGIDENSIWMAINDTDVYANYIPLTPTSGRTEYTFEVSAKLHC